MRALREHVENGISASCSGTRGGMGDERGSGELASGERAGSGFGGAPEQELGDAQRGSAMRFCPMAWRFARFSEIFAVRTNLTNQYLPFDEATF